MAPVEVVRFGPDALEAGVETHIIGRVAVRIYSPAKTIIDLFRHASRQHRRGGAKTGSTEALRAMKEALRVHKGHAGRNSPLRASSWCLEDRTALPGGADLGCVSRFAISALPSGRAFSILRRTATSRSTCC